MDERDQKRQLVDEQTEGTGRLRSGVETARGGVDRARDGADRARLAVEDAGWFLRQHVAWPVEDSFERLGRRGAIGVFGGGGVAVAGVVAALVIASSGGSGTNAGTIEAFVTPGGHRRFDRQTIETLVACVRASNRDTYEDSWRADCAISSVPRSP